MPIESPRRAVQNALTIVNPVELYGDSFLNLLYRKYSSNRLDGNSDGAARDFDRLYATLAERMGGAPHQETIAGVGMVGSREATVQIYHQQDGISIKRGIQITFQDDPTTIYFFGDGAHIVTVDPRRNAVLTHELRRDQDARQLMSDLVAGGQPS